jgi:hypothetical protein
MLDRLAEAARRQREFVSDASHELRSPIAATRVQIEVALAHPDRAAPAAVLHGVLAETTRLETLVADLLALARLDERAPAPHEEIDLDDVVLEDAVRSRALAIDTRGVAAIEVCGERASLGHLARNLLDNAARHATGQVAVATCLRDGCPPRPIWQSPSMVAPPRSTPAIRRSCRAGSPSRPRAITPRRIAIHGFTERRDRNGGRRSGGAMIADHGCRPRLARGARDPQRYRCDRNRRAGHRVRRG